MRNLYIIFTITIVFMLLLVAGVFLFFEKEKHRFFYYTIESESEKVGYIKIDRYETEDKIIYKSATFRPKKLNNKITHERLVFGRKDLRIVKFAKEYKNFGVTTETVNIKQNPEQTLDFLAKIGSKFSIASGIENPKDATLFDEESIVTYIPFVDKYNFRMGGAQSFNAIYHSLNLLPPARFKISLTSIKDEYINVDGKKTKTEYLSVKVKTFPEIYIWVSKKDRDIVRLEIKSRSLLIEKVGTSQKITVQDYRVKDPLYDSHDIIFPSGDIALAGTIAIPRKEDNNLPGVLLVAGEGPYDRENGGLYTDISQELARNGYVALRFDRRGMGKSQGDYMAASLDSEIKDIENALKFLLNHERVDKDKIFIVAHGDGCSYLTQLDFSKFPVKGLAMLGVTRPTAFLDFKTEYVLDKIKVMSELDEDYQETLKASKEQTLNLINTKKEYVVIQGKRVFFKRMAQFLEFKPLKGFKKFDIPLIMVHGKKDRIGSLKYLKDIEKNLEESGFQQYSVVYFRNLGHFFGEVVNEKDKINHYRVNQEVLETIRDWLNSYPVDS